MMNKLPNSDYANENDRPKAYMVWMLFDNEMKLVKTGKSSGARQIPEGAGQVKQMAENEIVMDQGGFLTAYTVNESPASVYIDNFQLSMVSGKVLEINNYYPFGMLNEGITDPGISDPLNNYKYNGKELQKELSLEWLDYGARFYDPQIGRWHVPDLLAEFYYDQSPYNYVTNDPLSFIDPDGNFKTKFGAWLYKIFNGGGDILKEKGGEYFVSQRIDDTNDDDVVDIIIKRTFDWNGRSDGKDLKFEETKGRYIANLEWAQTLAECGIEYHYTNDVNEARMSMLQLSANLLLPNILKATSLITNTTKTTLNTVDDVIKQAGKLTRVKGGVNKVLLKEIHKKCIIS